MPTLAQVDPERAHSATVYVASKGLAPRDLRKDPQILVLKVTSCRRSMTIRILQASTVWGRHYSNPIGLAAGFDKHAEAYLGMLAMGFGFVEIGSVSPRPQGGNLDPACSDYPKIGPSLTGCFHHLHLILGPSHVPPPAGMVSTVMGTL